VRGRTWPRVSRGAAECVSGILIDNGRVLVERRRADDDADPGFVLVPGGHVEPGESFDHALRREMREELGITARKISPVQVRYHTASDGERQKIHYFHIEHWTGDIKSKEAEEVYWESCLDNLSDVTERNIILKVLHRRRLR
jgi:8-oxo-dGTP diphosphatase